MFNFLNKKMKVFSNEMKHFHRNIINIIFLLAIFIIFLLSFVSINQMINLVKANHWVTHTYQVITTSQETLNDLTYLESQLHAYLLLDNQTYISNFDEIQAKIKKSLDSMINLTSDNFSQNAKIKNLYELMTHQINILNEIVKVKNKSNVISPEILKLFQTSEILSYQIRLLSHQIVDIEYAFLNVRNQNAIDKAYTMNIFFIAGEITAVLFLFITFVLFNREISKRFHAENESRAIENQLRSIIEGASDMIAAIDLNYRFIIFNTAYENEFLRLFNKKIAVGMSLDEILSDMPDIKNELKQSWKASLEGKEYVQNIEFVINDKKTIFEITSSLIKDLQKNIIGAVHIKRNITERINKEKQLNEGMAELKDKNEKITLLLEMSDILLACNSITELSEITAKYCNKIFDFSKGALYIMHTSKNFLDMVATWGNTPESMTSNFSQDQCWALRLGHIHYTVPSNMELICPHIHNNNTNNSYLCVPLRAQNDIYGLLFIEIINNDGIRQLTSNQRLIVNAFAEVSALALANVRLRENLSYQSIRDPLTSLYNRRYLEEFIFKQIYQSERTKSPISILMIDIDYFKRINDVHGHEAGDLVLKQISQVFINKTRSGDMVARYGGEEFIIVLYNTSVDNALKRANDIRNAVSLLHIKYGAQDMGEITVSIGISAYPNHGDNGLALIEAADKALYLAKNTGRNKVVLFSNPQ